MAKLALPVTEIDTQSADRGQSRATSNRRPQTCWTSETWQTGEVADVPAYARIAVEALFRVDRQAEERTSGGVDGISEAKPIGGVGADVPSLRAA